MKEATIPVELTVEEYDALQFILASNNSKEAKALSAKLGEAWQKKVSQLMKGLR